MTKKNFIRGIKPTLFLALICTAFMFSGCFISKKYTDHYAPIASDSLVSISIEILNDSIKTINIIQKIEIDEFVSEINNAKYNGPWKGAHWDRISLNYVKDTINFMTNGKVFGKGSSGYFYTLNDKYQIYWEKQIQK